MFSATEILEFDVETDSNNAVLFKELRLEKIHIDSNFPWNDDPINERNFVNDGQFLCLSKDETDYTRKGDDPDLQYGQCVSKAFFGGPGGPGDDGGYWEVELRTASSEEWAGTKDDVQVELLAPGAGQVTKSKHLTFERNTLHVIKSDTRIDKIRLLASGGDALLLRLVEVWYIPLMGKAQRIVGNWVPDDKVLCLSTDPSDFGSLGDRRAYNLCLDNWTLNIRKFDESI